jgi:hypothetical protein
MFLLLIFICSGITSYSQESVNSTGNKAIGAGGIVDYSIGTVFYSGLVGQSGKVTQGIQHSYSIESTDIKEIVEQNAFSVYPNPSSDNLTLDISHYLGEDLSYQIVDIKGVLVQKGIINNKITNINLSELLTSSYYLHIYNSNKNNIQTFKIIVSEK